MGRGKVSYSYRQQGLMALVSYPLSLDTSPIPLRYAICELPNKGDLEKCANYRTIALVSHASKILLSVRLQHCIVDINHWMSASRLKLNMDKTELISTGTEYSDITAGNAGFLSLQLGADVILPSQHVRLLRLVISADLGLEKHVSNVSATCFRHLRQLRHIHPALTVYRVCCNTRERFRDVLRRLSSSSSSSSLYLPNNTTVCTSTSIHLRREGQQGLTRTLTAALKRLTKQLLDTYSITQVKYYKQEN